MANDKRERQRQRAIARQAEALKRQKRRQNLKTFGIGLVVVAILAGTVIGAVGLGDDNTNATATTTTTINPADLPLDTAVPTVTVPPTVPAQTLSADDCPPVDGSGEQKREFDLPPALCINPSNIYIATFATDLGNFTVQLTPDKAPYTVNNFVFLARNKYYDDTVFHRAQSDFVIQGGDPTATGSGGPGYRFGDELPTTPYAIGDIAMANSGPNTNGSQFFVITGNNGASLPASYSRFGKVISGQDVVAQLGSGPFGDQIPVETAHKIIAVTIQEINAGDLAASDATTPTTLPAQ